MFDYIYDYMHPEFQLIMNCLQGILWPWTKYWKTNIK